MNSMLIIGNLTRDPELRTVNTKNGASSVCTFSVAVNDRARDTADFFRVTVWGKTGENCMKYLHKGSKVCCHGDVHLSMYTKQDGGQGASLELTAREVEFLDRKGEDTGAPASMANPEPVQQKIDTQSGMTVAEPNDLPF